MAVEHYLLRTIVDRIEAAREEEGFHKSSQFSETLEFSNSNYSRIVNNVSSKPTLELVISFLNRFKNYRTDWIIFGKEPKHAEDPNYTTSSKDSAFSSDFIEIQQDIVINSQHDNIVELAKTINDLRKENLRLKKRLNEEHINY